MGVELGKFLERRKETILRGWFTLILEDYPPETRMHWEAPGNAFANPIGSTFRQGLEGILTGLRQGLGSKDLAGLLDPLIHIRAVQDLAPSQAVGFVLGLKGIIRGELDKDGGGRIPREEMWEMETRIDELALAGFDQYALCRKKVYDIQLQEMRNRALEWGKEHRP